MNIFYLDKSPVKAAQMMCDKHVVKMILESAQLLSTAHRVLDGELKDVVVNGKSKKKYVLPDDVENFIYKATHINHPSARWVREAGGNYAWLVVHLNALLDEYTHRYKKVHKVRQTGLNQVLSVFPEKIQPNDWLNETPIPCAMPQEYIVSQDPVENYREYYRKGKTNLLHYTNRERPSWL
jgi:hypothetical protein